MRTRSFLLFFILLHVAVDATAAAGCANGLSGYQDEDAGASADAGSFDAPSVVFPPDDPSTPQSPPPEDETDAPDDAPLILPPPPDDDAGPLYTGPSFDAGPDGECAGPLAPGDLAIDEILIESMSGTGDHGEWLEVASTRDCALDLIGLQGECPVGAKVVSFEVSTDVWVPAGGYFVVADSTDPAVNHALPGIVLGWSDDPGDVLRNEGATVTLIAGGALIDSVTYPDIKKLTVGASTAFPSDCPMGARSNWALWQTSQASWFPGFYGTPNAPNDDVHCPDD